MVWDFSKETDMLIARSGKGDESHSEPISKVMWQKASGKGRVFNVSDNKFHAVVHQIIQYMCTPHTGTRIAFIVVPGKKPYGFESVGLVQRK